MYNAVWCVCVCVCVCVRVCVCDRLLVYTFNICIVISITEL